jgi:hypothetical protein
MLRIGQKEPWTTIAFASGALGLALYYYLSSATTITQPAESEQPCQDTPSDLVADNMNLEERAYHERFMREAIGMVSHTLHTHAAPAWARLRLGQDMANTVNYRLNLRSRAMRLPSAVCL